MNLQEHADKIKAAFEAAEEDGFVIGFEWDYDDHEPGELESLSLDINEYGWAEVNGKNTRKIQDWVVLREESF
jgi:hypothetical protein